MSDNMLKRRQTNEPKTNSSKPKVELFHFKELAFRKLRMTQIAANGAAASWFFSKVGEPQSLVIVKTLATLFQIGFVSNLTSKEKNHHLHVTGACSEGAAVNAGISTRTSVYGFESSSKSGTRIW